MAGTTFDAMVAQNSDLIRKMLGGGAAFVAPMETTAVTALTAGAGAVLQTLPAGFTCLGLTDKSGVEYGREQNASNVNSWGKKQPSRIDIVSDIDSAKIICQETNINTLALDLGVRVEDLVANVTTGEVVLHKPSTAAKLFERLFIIGRDVVESGEIYFARQYRKAQVTVRAGQKWQDSDDAPVQYDLTFTAFEDDDGESVDHFFAGPGWKALLEPMGFVIDSD